MPDESQSVIAEEEVTDSRHVYSDSAGDTEYDGACHSNSASYSCKNANHLPTHTQIVSCEASSSGEVERSCCETESEIFTEQSREQTEEDTSS